MRVMYLILLPLFFGGCISSLEEGVELNTSIRDDSDYNKVYETYSRSFDVISRFATKYQLTVTFLSEPFLHALAERHKRLYGNEEPLLTEASSKTSFFVSMYASEESGYKLTDENLWKIVLEVNGGERKSPILIKRLLQKERWTPFFKDVSFWSHEYLIVFENKLLDPVSQELVQKTAINLSFSNADAIVTAKW